MRVCAIVNRLFVRHLNQSGWDDGWTVNVLEFQGVINSFATAGLDP